MDLGFVCLIYSGYPSISQIVAFVRAHPNLVFLWHKGKNFQAIKGDCRLAPPINFIRGISAAVNWTPLDSNRQDNRTNADP